MKAQPVACAWRNFTTPPTRATSVVPGSLGVGLACSASPPLSMLCSHIAANSSRLSRSTALWRRETSRGFVSHTMSAMATADNEDPDDEEGRRQYSTDPNTFVMENERLNDGVAELRKIYDAHIKAIKPELDDLTRDRANEFKVSTLNTVLPRFLVRINNNAQSFLSAGLNFLRATVDLVANHVQAKVAHFHHAHLTVGIVMDEHLAAFAARLQGLSARAKGIEHFIGISSSTATAHARDQAGGELTVMQRLSALEATAQKLKSEVLTLQLVRMRHGEDLERSRSRDVSPSGRSAASAGSGTSSRASSLHEAHLFAEVARQQGDMQARVSAAQDIAYFRRSQ